MFPPTLFKSTLVLDTERSIRFQAELEISKEENQRYNLCIFGPNGVGKTRVLQLLQLHFEGSDRFASEPLGTLVITLHESDEEAFFLVSEGGSEVSPARAIRANELIRESYEGVLANKIEVEEFVSLIHEGDATAGNQVQMPTMISLHGRVISTEEFEWEDVLQEISEVHRSRFLSYMAEEEIQQLTVSQALQQFEATHPSPHKTLATLWNPFLAPSDFSLCEESSTFLRLSTKEEIHYSDIPEAVQVALLNSALTLLTLLQSEENPLLLLLDAPEDGLYPDFVQGYITLLSTIAEQNPFQLVATTRSPHLASLFPSSRRIRMELTENGFQSFQGDSVDQPTTGSVFDKAPDPEELEPPKKPMSRKARYAQLKKAIDETDDQEELANLVDELMSLRNL